jgi:RNA-dependent RNA polymerase
VIVCSTRGSRRQADLLAGGDYDGDKVLAIWQPELVDPFVNADEKYTREPEGVMGCFDCEQGTVEEFLAARDGRDGGGEGEEIKVLQKALLGALRDPGVVGMYSTFHENAIYHLGYGHEETVRLAYK